MSAALYPWLKALHVIAIISWMAGLLYLPRLFVYHVDAPTGSPSSETFKVMERRLLRFIMNPAMIVSWLTGLTLAIWSGLFTETWFIFKFAFVCLLTASHMYMASARRAFDEDRNLRTQKHFRILNEAPTLLMIGIVVMVIVRPF